MTALRDGLLDGVAVGIHGDPPPAVAVLLRRLGADLAGGADASRHVVAVPEGTLLDRLDAVWGLLAPPATRLVERGGPGRLVLIAPPSGEHAAAVRAGVENLARTLGTEWARHGITAVAVLAGADPAPLAELVAYLLSPAGDYVSGCALELGSVAVSSAHGTTTASS